MWNRLWIEILIHTCNTVARRLADSLNGGKRLSNEFAWPALFLKQQRFMQLKSCLLTMPDIADACCNGLESCSLSWDEKQTFDCKSNQPSSATQVSNKPGLQRPSSQKPSYEIWSWMIEPWLQKPMLPKIELWKLKLKEQRRTAKAQAPKTQATNAKVGCPSQDCETPERKNP